MRLRERDGPARLEVDDVDVHVVAQVRQVDEPRRGPGAVGAGHRQRIDVLLVRHERRRYVEAVDALVGLADPVERRRPGQPVVQRPVRARRQVGVAARPQVVVPAVEGERSRPSTHEQHRLGRRVRLGVVGAAAARRPRSTYWLNVSAKPVSGRASTQTAGLLPAGEVRRDDVAHASRAGITAYASVKRARSVVSAVCGGSPPRRYVVAHRSPLASSRPRGLVVRPVRRAARSRRTTPARRRPAYAETVLRWCSRDTSTDERLVGREHAPGRRRAPTSIRPLCGQPDPVGGRGRHPADHVGERDARGRGRRSRRPAARAAPRRCRPRPARSRGTLRSAVHGEWSDTTKSMSPAARRRPQQPPVGGLADRRAALELGGAVGHVLGVEASGSAGRSRRRRRRPRPARRAGGGTAPAADRCTTWARPPVARAASITSPIAASSDRRRPRGQEVGVRGRVQRRRVDEVTVLGVHDHQRAQPGGLGHRDRELVGRQVAGTPRPRSRAGST